MAIHNMRSAQEIIITCPACRDGISTSSARATYAYARAYLCDEHRDAWSDADEHAHYGVASGKRACPHHPERCVMQRDECAVGDAAMERVNRLGGSRS